MRRIAFVLGGASSVWEEIEQARQLAEPDLIIATNHAGRDYPGPVDHWVSMHSDLLPHWASRRSLAGHPPAGQFWGAAHRQHLGGPDKTRRIKSPGGSSGLLAVWVGLELECTHMILCGMPMHQNGRHFDHEARWREARQYWGAWTRALPVISGRVKSLGGETFKWLGGPTQEWLDGEYRQDAPRSALG